MDHIVPRAKLIVTKAFFDYIYSGAINLKGIDRMSVLEFLYMAYTEIQVKDPEEINRGFIDLDNHLESLSLDENNQIFQIVCSLCNAYEKRAFLDAIQIGAQLVLELQEK